MESIRSDQQTKPSITKLNQPKSVAISIKKNLTFQNVSTIVESTFIIIFHYNQLNYTTRYKPDLNNTYNIDSTYCIHSVNVFCSAHKGKAKVLIHFTILLVYRSHAGTTSYKLVSLIFTCISYIVSLCGTFSCIS